MTSENVSPREVDPLLAPNQRNTALPLQNNTTRTVLWSLAVVAFISMSYAFIEAPGYRLYETVICKRYYRKHDPSAIGSGGVIPEEKCKIDSIQQELAMLLAKQGRINLLACK